jgi:3-hydroxyisobutyrate dehydrogenase-like beta-hydroxyacid dehydrogenase
MAELAFLGTAVMGLPMARNLNNAGCAVHAYNRTLERARRLETHDVAVFSDAAEAAAGCPVMVTMVCDGDALRAAALWYVPARPG